MNKKYDFENKGYKPMGGTNLDITPIPTEITSIESAADYISVPPVRVRFYPTDTDETFEGTVLEETPYSYFVIPDDNLTGTARWNKNRCDLLR